MEAILLEETKEGDDLAKYYEEYMVWDLPLYKTDDVDISILIFEPNNPDAKHLHTVSTELLTLVEESVSVNDIDILRGDLRIKENVVHNVRNTGEADAIVLDQMIPNLELADMEMIKQNEKIQ